MSAEPTAAAQPNVIYIRTEREPRAPKEKPFNLDLGFLTIPAIIAGGAVFYYVYKDEITEIINKIANTDIIPIPTPSPSPSPSPVPTPTPTPGGATGAQWFRAGGASTNIPAGRQDGQSNRWSKNVQGWQNGFEVMGYLTVTGMQTASHIGLKMAGPNHSGSCSHKEGGACCCWWDGGLRRNGDSYLEIEYPHPTNKNEKKLGSIGRNIDAGVLGVRWLNAKEGNARRVMFWVDKSGKANAHQWTLVYNVLDTGQFMPTSYYSKIPSDIELEIRISDVPAKNIKWSTGPVARQITGASSNLAYSYASMTTDFGRISVA